MTRDFSLIASVLGSGEDVILPVVAIFQGYPSDDSEFLRHLAAAGFMGSDYHDLPATLRIRQESIGA